MDLTPYPPIDPVVFNEAEAYIHRVAQFLAMVGKNYVDPKEDDSHANLSWNEETQCLESRKIDAYHLQLHLPTFSLDWMKDDHVISYFPVDKTHKTDIFSWLRNQFGASGYDPEHLKFIDHYDVPEHEVDRGEPFRKPKRDLLDAWIVQRSNANEILKTLNSIVGEDSEVRIWPHHFDTGTYYPFGERQAIGAGWAIGDNMSAYPYLYIYPWEKDKEIDLSGAPKLDHGVWRQGGWTGAVLGIDELLDIPDPTESVASFLKTVTAHFKTILAL